MKTKRTYFFRKLDASTKKSAHLPSRRTVSARSLRHQFRKRISRTILMMGRLASLKESQVTRHLVATLVSLKKLVMTRQIRTSHFPFKRAGTSPEFLIAQLKTSEVSKDLFLILKRALSPQTITSSIKSLTRSRRVTRMISTIAQRMKPRWVKLSQRSKQVRAGDFPLYQTRRSLYRCRSKTATQRPSAS